MDTPSIPEVLDNAVPKGAANQRTTLWAVDFDELLKDPSGLFAFRKFLELEFSAENIHFWIECQQLRIMKDPLKIRSTARSIYDKYLSPQAQEPVNIDNGAKLRAKIEAADADVNSFAEAENQVYKLMRDDSYQRFLRSEIFAKCVKKEKDGKVDFEQLVIKKSKGKFFWNRSSSLKTGTKKRLSFDMRPRSLNFDTNETPRSKETSSSSVSRSAASSSVTSNSRRDHILMKTNSLPSPTSSNLSCFNTSLNKSSISSELFSQSYPSPPPIVPSRKNLLSRSKTPFGSLKYEFYNFNKGQSSNVQSQGQSSDLFRTDQEIREDDLLSSIISASQHVPLFKDNSKSSRTKNEDDFDSPRDLFRFLSQPNLASPNVDNQDEDNNQRLQSNICSYLSPSLNDVVQDQEGDKMLMIRNRKVKKQRPCHRMYPPPPPPASKMYRPVIPIPRSSEMFLNPSSSSGTPPNSGQSSSSNSGPGRTPLKRLPTNFDQSSSIYV